VFDIHRVHAHRHAVYQLDRVERVQDAIEQQLSSDVVFVVVRNHRHRLPSGVVPAKEQWRHVAWSES
jgi:hypothetical protein